MRLLPALLVLSGCGPASFALDGDRPARERPRDDETIPDAPGTDDDPEDDEEGCPSLYAQDRMPDFRLDLTAAEWAGVQSDYASGVKQWRPAAFTYVEEDGTAHVVEEASVRLRGNPGFSWLGQKMQFAIAFNQEDPDGRFQGLRKLTLDASWYEPSLLRDRLGYRYLRARGIPAPCANNATLTINGAYYGVYKNIEFMDHELLERVFGDALATGGLWKYGSEVTANEEAADPDAIAAFWANSSVAWQEANTPLAANVAEWSAEAMLAQNDGYWCCTHNFYLYEHPTDGVMFLPWDLDYSMDAAPYDADPYTFYRDRNDQWHVDAVTADPVWGPRFVEAMRASVDAWDVAALDADLVAWSAQIAEAVEADPHRTISVGEHEDAVAAARAFLPARKAAMEAWVDCREGAPDGDGDGAGPCDDCDDDDATIHPGATEACNARDDDCDGLTDDDPACDTCVEHAFEGSRMLVCPQQRTWAEAEAVCESHGGALGFPQSTGDWYVFFIHTYWDEEAWAGIGHWWGGASDAASEGTWVTPGGADASAYAAWVAGAPGGGRAENCAALLPGSFAWEDRRCEEAWPFLCRLP